MILNKSYDSQRVLHGDTVRIRNNGTKPGTVSGNYSVDNS